MNILWLKSEVLHPVDKGGRIRTYQMLRHLKREHTITYLTLARPDDAPQAFEQASEYCHRLISIRHDEARKFSAKFYFELGMNLWSRLPYALQKYVSSAMTRAIQDELQAQAYDVVVCDFLFPSVNFISQTTVASVLFQHNVESVIWQRHYETATQVLKKAYFYAQWRKMLAYERAACRRFDAVIAVSPVDRDLLRDEFGALCVYDVATGVDTAYFSADESCAPQPHHLVFTGSMDWLPNGDGILWFVEQVLPRIKQQLPDVKLTVVGRNPHAKLIEMSQRDAALEVTGRVDDVRPYMNRAAAYVVPIRIGGGTRIKIYEAMAMSKPVISTTIGAEGLPVKDGTDLLLADSPDEFAQATIRVLTDQAFAHQLGQRAMTRVREQFGWQSVAASFADLCGRAVRHRQVKSGDDARARNLQVEA